MDKIAVVILNWNGCEMLRSFLPSVVRYSKTEGAKIYVADNGSTDASVDMLRQEFPDVHLIILKENYKALYSIAARCGVFAKSDIQPLINEGASKEDLAASIFQAVVNQTISGLACGKPIRGHVAFLGGPLHFLSELRETFIRTLKLDDEHIIAPHHSHLFAAIGSALNSKKDTPTALCELQKRLENKIQLDFEVERLDPLFETSADYDKFISRHSKHQVPIKDLATYTGKAFLGIDAGSTTTKAALVGEDGTLLYSFYHNNDGDPLGTTISAIKDIYRQLPEDVEIVHSCSTGYGEALIKSALMLDEGEQV